MESLWNMLGGDARMKAIVDDFVDLAMGDPRVNYTRNGRYFVTPEGVAQTKKAALAFFSGATGGPVPYRGRSIREIHAGMRITDSEFNAVAENFRTALHRNGVDSAVITAAMAAVENVRGKIVE